MNHKTITLYTCGTTWSSDADPSNSGALEFYTSAEAVLDSHDCATECGVVEIKATFKHVAVDGTGFHVPVLDLPERARMFEADNKTINDLADRVLTILDEHTLKEQASALTVALARIEDKLRQERRKKRIGETS